MNQISGRKLQNSMQNMWGPVELFFLNILGKRFFLKVNEFKLQERVRKLKAEMCGTLQICLIKIISWYLVFPNFFCCRFLNPNSFSNFSNCSNSLYLRSLQEQFFLTAVDQNSEKLM